MSTGGSAVVNSISTFFASFFTYIQSIWTRFRSEEDNVMCYASGLPKTHASLARHVVGDKGSVTCKTTHVRNRDGDDDLKDLIVAARQEVYSKAVEAGGNALAEESWICNIKEKGSTYSIMIKYRAKAIVSRKPDPQIPVNLDNALAFDDEPEMEVSSGNRNSWRRRSLCPSEPRWNDARRVSIVEMSQSPSDPNRLTSVFE